MKSQVSLRLRVTGAIASAALALLAACGGGGSSAPEATVAAAARALSVSGTITGFGSVIIDGVRYDDSKVAVGVDNGASAPTAGAVGDLKLGMTIDAKVRDGSLTEVLVRAALAGPIGAIDAAAASFNVYGQTVKVTTTGATPTLFEGVAGLAGLAPGDRVEVHGTVDATKAIVATRIERKPREAAEPAARIGGVVTALDAAAKTLRLNDLTVDFGAASVTPAGKTLANGQLVVAFGDTAPAAGHFTAKALRIAGATDGSEFGIGGRINAYTSLADFTVSGVRVDASAAKVEGGTAADLAAGVIVGAEGTVTDGVLKAGKLRIIKSPTDALASLKGQVTDFTAASSFKLRGTTVDASAASFVGGVAADLGNGAWIEVAGKVQGDLFKADRVQFMAPPAAQPIKLSGEMRDWNATARTLRLMGMAVRLGEAVEYEGGTAALLAEGRRVALVGTPNADGVVVATKIAFLGELTPPTAAVAGGRAFDVGAGAFKLPGLGVSYDAQTRFEGGSATDIANGVLVFAKGRFDAATKSIKASWIEIVKVDLTVPRIAGPVSDFVSVSDFRIGGQKVDASGATFVDGQAQDLANGVSVMATGTLAERAGARVFVASKLRFMQ